MKWKELLPVVVLISLIVTSCGTAVPPTPGNNAIVDIEIQKMEAVPQEVSTETVTQNNCGGTAEAENELEKSRTITYVMEVQNGMSVNATGQVGFAGTGVELGSTIAAQFGQSYGTSDSVSRSITVKAQAGTKMQHVIRHMEVWEIGQAKVTVGGQETIIPFKYRSDFALELAGSKQLQCDPNETPNGISTDTQPAPEITPTTATIGLSTGMDARLVADKTDGRHPLAVYFDARGSFFRDANGDMYPCGLCNYSWSVYQGGSLINDPKWDDNGTFNYRFGKAGDYRVVVTVCRKQSETDCASDAEDISVR